MLVDFVHLLSPAYLELKKRVQAAGGAGEVTSVVSAGCGSGPFRTWSSLRDYGAHDVSLCLDLLGATSALRDVEAKRVPSELDRGELFEVVCNVERARVSMRLGSGARTKARRFEVTLRSGRRLVYDDTVAHPSKLTDGGEPVEVAGTLPLDAVLNVFMSSVDAWQRKSWAGGETLAQLAFAGRVLAGLDTIARELI